MTRPNLTPPQQLAKRLSTKTHCRQTRVFRAHCLWVLKNGGVYGLDSWLEARYELGLHDDDYASATHAREITQVAALAGRAQDYQFRQWQQQREEEVLTHDERLQRIQRRQQLEHQRRQSVWSHVPKPERKISAAERMTKAWERLNQSA